MANKDKVADTAVGPIVIATVENALPPERRLLSDDLAVRMLPGWAGWLVSRAPLRRILISMMDKEGPGMWNSLACRKHYFDDQLGAALADGVGQVVLLGAGFDTRGYRLAAPQGIPAFDVDKPATLTTKQQRMPRPATVVPVPIDFETQDVGTVLTAHGYRPDVPTAFVWEAVSQYLTEPAVRATFDFFAKSAPGSRLIFTFVQQDFLAGTNLYDSPKTYQRFVIRQGIWKYGLEPAEVGPLLAEYGWREVEQVGGPEHWARYVQPAGRPGPVSDIEHCVYAAKP